jgi:hypothetical protein
VEPVLGAADKVVHQGKNRPGVLGHIQEAFNSQQETRIPLSPKGDSPLRVISMGLPALLLVALVGWGARAPAAAPAASPLAQADEAPSKPAKDKSTVANPGQSEE